MTFGSLPSSDLASKNMLPLEPEMVLQLTSMKIAWTNSRTKSVTAPTPDQSCLKSHLKYLSRPPHNEEISFLKWLRLYDHEKSPPKPYKGGNTLVAVKHLSPFNPLYFYQLLVMNMPHHSVDELVDLHEDRLPQPIKYFVPAREKLPVILGSCNAILRYLSSESHKRSHVDTLLHYMKSLEDIYTMWQLGIIDTTFALCAWSQFKLQYRLSPQCRTCFIKGLCRTKYYFTLLWCRICTVGLESFIQY